MQQITRKNSQKTAKTLYHNKKKHKLNKKIFKPEANQRLLTTIYKKQPINNKTKNTKKKE